MSDQVEWEGYRLRQELKAHLRDYPLPLPVVKRLYRGRIRRSMSGTTKLGSMRQEPPKMVATTSQSA